MILFKVWLTIHKQLQVQNRILWVETPLDPRNSGSFDLFHSVMIWKITTWFWRCGSAWRRWARGANYPLLILPLTKNSYFIVTKHSNIYFKLEIMSFDKRIICIFQANSVNLGKRVFMIWSAFTNGVREIVRKWKFCRYLKGNMKEIDWLVWRACDCCDADKIRSLNQIKHISR